MERTCSFHNEQKPKKKNYSRSLFRFFSWGIPLLVVHWVLHLWQEYASKSQIQASMTLQFEQIYHENWPKFVRWDEWHQVPTTNMPEVGKRNPGLGETTWNMEHAKQDLRFLWNVLLQDAVKSSQTTKQKPKRKSEDGEKRPPASYWTPGPYLCRTALQAFPSSNVMCRSAHLYPCYRAPVFGLQCQAHRQPGRLGFHPSCLN